MEIENKTRWHPAFCASMELELLENKSGLLYDSEHNLGSEPLRIDLLIIKKKPDEVIRNEIGAFFLGHNIVEYKSPDDKVNIDTFYKVLSYACLYKSDAGTVDEILDTDITITLIREQKPKKLLGQLDGRYGIVKGGEGIYRIDGMLFPMQVIVTKELEGSSHVWLKALTRSMDPSQAEELLDCCEKLQDGDAYKKARTVVNLASDVNDEVFLRIVEGGERMSETLRNMLLPELGETERLLEDERAKRAESEAKLAESEAKLAESKEVIAALERKLAAAGL